MRAPWSRRHQPLPAAARAVLALGAGERVLAWTTDLQGTVLVVTTTHLYAVSASASGGAGAGGRAPDGSGRSAHVEGPGTREAGGTVLLGRSWHLVDGGRWNAETSSLSVTWVDGERRGRWVLEDAGEFLQALRERVQASVVLGEAVDIGPGRTARVVVRRDLADGRLLGQTILGRGVSLEEPGVRAATDAALAGLREQVGLD